MGGQRLSFAMRPKVNQNLGEPDRNNGSQRGIGRFRLRASIRLRQLRNRLPSRTRD